MQDVLVLHTRSRVCEAAFGGQVLAAPKYTFSACKSVVSLAVGLLIDDGVLHLEDKVADLFEDLLPPAARRRLRSMSVEDLLTMRSGIVFSEAESLTESDWVRGFLNSTMKGEPGGAFHYNSLNTYMLSAIIWPQNRQDSLGLSPGAALRASGHHRHPVGDLSRRHRKGGLGPVYSTGGSGQAGTAGHGRRTVGRTQLISQDYLRAATTAHANPPSEFGDFDYGYQVWVGRRDNAFLFNGMLGQNVLGFRDSGILVVTNAGADTDFQESRYFEIVSRYFGGTFPDTIPEDDSVCLRLAEYAAALSDYHRAMGALDSAAAPFLDRSFDTSDPRAAAVGLLPMVLQALHNNYTSGVVSVAVSTRGGLRS